jgi:glycosyltransferase involved in cell wall biosynthesis
MKNLGLRDDIQVIGNSISDEFFYPPQDVASQCIFPLKEGCILFGAWTRWRGIKRLDLLLAAFNKAYKRNNKLRLVIAGPIEPQQQKSLLLDFIHANGLNECVQYLGSVGRDEIHKLAYMVDCVVVSSDFETFALPVIEGMAAGKPAIVTKCNGPESVVTNDRLGKVVEKDNDVQLSDAMLEVAQELDMFDADYIKKYAFENFSQTSIGNKYHSLLKEAIRQHSISLSIFKKHND